MQPLSQDQLAAFAAVVRTGSFTRAAGELHVSQPALSRRIAALEERLATAVVVRGPREITLTDAGRRLLAFVHAQRALEDELLSELAPGSGDQGVLRIAGLSSVVPPIVMPALAPFLLAHPAVQVEVHSIEVGGLSAALAQGATDLAVSNIEPEHGGLVNLEVGVEEYVLIERVGGALRSDVFLDTSPADRITEEFFAHQPARLRLKRWRRSFLHDDPGILLGVELGLGRAISPRHTIPAHAHVRIDPRFTPMHKPVYLQYRAQRYYGRLHREATALIERALRKRLAPRKR
jgi:DNA-binding transcriptional LysR family regulator